MNPTLAAMYNTHGTNDALHREQVKIAHLDLFAKTAAASGINLSELDPHQRTALFQEFTQKIAEEGGAIPEEFMAQAEGDDGDKDKGEGKSEESSEGEDKGEEESADEPEAPEEEKKEARAHFEAMRHWHEQTAEADFLGRQMAHSFEDERMKIAAAREGKTVKTASAAPALPPHPTKKLASAKATSFDKLAARQAVKIAQQAGLPVNDVVQHLNARLTLGVPPLDKTASAMNDYGHALNVRALELLESIGVQVNWQQVLR